MSHATYYISYYNFCTGWSWVWSGWEPGDTFGVCVPVGYDVPGTWLDVSWHYVRTACPSGYGFTGTAQVHAGNDIWCPIGAPLAIQTWLPAAAWNGFLWRQQVPRPFVVAVTTGPGAGNPLSIDTDHPAAGATGPAACGFCYLATRVSHSFFYGSAVSPLCPGSPFNDGTCNAELHWELGISNIPVAVEATSWGRIKSIYR